MPKKSARSKKPSRKKTSPLSRKIVFVFLGCAVLLLSGVLSLAILDGKKPCANSISCIKDLSGKFEENAEVGVFQGRTVRVPTANAMAYVQTARDVLGESTGSKKIMVNLTNQRLYAYEGDRVVMDFPVSTGKWNHTPTGTFHIWVKLRYTRMTGGSGSDYYNLPNVPYTMFYYNNEVPQGDGYSIHGAYWHNNFGHPMSHGCINMKIADAGQLFEWADPAAVGWQNRTTEADQGTQVIVYGETPTE